MFREAKLSPPEREVLGRAAVFTAVAFRGSARYDRATADTLEGALNAARSLYEGDRGVMIYAIDAAGRQAMLGSWECR